MINRKPSNYGNVAPLGRNNVNSIHFEVDGTYRVELEEVGDYFINTLIIIIFSQMSSSPLSVV
jgi:hypothetical protein